MSKGGISMITLENVCIYCGEPLSVWERTRSYCWNCNELTSAEAFNEDTDDYWIDILFQEP